MLSMTYQLTTPVALLIFNRPDTTQRVFAEIARAKSPKLLVVADGPRPDKHGEAEKCLATRAIIDQVDWPCEVLTNFSETNLGCKRRVSSGLDWVFHTVEEAIILEDDCLPEPTFFRYCEELLETYRHDTRIMAISGDNFQLGRKRTTDSYYFSRYFHCWGWASWQRAWQHYDAEMKLWPQIKEGGWLTDLLADTQAVKSWSQIFQAVYDGQINTWDFQWTLTCWLQHGLIILPNENLISNIGFTAEATHTTQNNKLANLPTTTMKFPLQHPLFMIQDKHADDFTQKQQYNAVNLLARTKAKIKKILSYHEV